MPTQEKIAAVADLKDRLERATIVVSTEYRGLTVKEMQDLRRKLRDGGIEMASSRTLSSSWRRSRRARRKSPASSKGRPRSPSATAT